jgi:hypothetical protein
VLHDTEALAMKGYRVLAFADGRFDPAPISGPNWLKALGVGIFAYGVVEIEKRFTALRNR